MTSSCVVFSPLSLPKQRDGNPGHKRRHSGLNGRGVTGTPYMHQTTKNIDDRRTSMKNTNRTTGMLAFILALWISCPAMAEEPLDLYPGPAGSAALLTYYTHITGNEQYSDGSKVSDDFNLTANIGTFRGVYYGELGGIRTCTNVIVPFGSASVDTTVPALGTPYDVHIASPSGMGDIILNSGVYLFFDEKTLNCLPISFFITAPTGDYDHNKTLNMGSNRWAFKPSVGYAHGIGSMGTIVETVAQAEFYTKNSEYGPANANLREDPFYTFQLMLTQFLDPGTFVSMDYFYEYGGETKIDGATQDDKIKTQALQFAMAHMITPTTQLMARYRSDFEVEDGTRTDTFQVRIAFLIPEFGKKK
jgi:hypothetical protein